MNFPIPQLADDSAAALAVQDAVQAPPGAVEGISTPESNNAPATPQLCRLSQLLGLWSAEAEAAYAARQNGVARGPITGFAKLDSELGGFLCPGLHIVHGQPGAGKTAFAWQVAATCGTPALFVSCEMGALELMRRHTARETSTYLGRFKTGELSPVESLNLAKRAVAAAPLLALVDATQAPANARYLLDCAQVVQGEHRHLLLIVDSVHSWAEGLANGANEYETLNLGLSALRQLAHRLNCPILAISERNRESMSGGGLSKWSGSRAGFH